jgi:protein tyrosine/serine phosphatase
MVRPEKPDSILSRQAPEVIHAILSAEPDYLDAALNAIEEQHGSVEGYLHEVLGIDASGIWRMRDDLLE